jgi:hypothetical protein
MPIRIQATNWMQIRIRNTALKSFYPAFLWAIPIYRYFRLLMSYSCLLMSYFLLLMSYFRLVIIYSCLVMSYSCLLMIYSRLLMIIPAFLWAIPTFLHKLFPTSHELFPLLLSYFPPFLWTIPAFFELYLPTFELLPPFYELLPPFMRYYCLGFPAKLVLFCISRNTKQVLCFVKQTCFVKFCNDAKTAVSLVSLFFKQNITVRFACFATNLYQILSFIKKIVNLW